MEQHQHTLSWITELVFSFTSSFQAKTHHQTWEGHSLSQSIQR